MIEEERLGERVRILRGLAATCALLSIGIAFTVLLAWVSRAREIEAVVPWLVAMKANTALGFASAGGSLLLLSRNRPHAAVALAAVPVVLGIATLAEYLTGADLAIDQLLVNDWSRAAGPSPGRAPPNAVIVLVLLGTGLLAGTLAGATHARNLAIRIIAFCIIVIGMEAIAGHIFQSRFAIGWGTAEKMSILSSLCAILLGIGVAALSWEAEVTAVTPLSIWILTLLCFALVLFDTSTSTDVDAGVGYTLLVLCALWFDRAEAAPIFAAIATFLITLGLFASPPGTAPFGVAMLNRIFAVGAVWLVALLVYLNHRRNHRLQRNEQHLAAAQKLAATGSFELEFAEMTFKGSEAFCAVHGLVSKDTHDWLAFLRRSVSPDERSGIEQMIEALRAGETADDLEYAFLDAHSETRIGLMHCEPLHNADGLPVGIIGVVQDVTALRHAKALQLDIEFQLRHAQKLEAVGLLAGGIAHDINNTLVPITTLTPLLIETAANEQDKESLEIIMDSARRAKTLVREMLLFSRKELAERETLRLDLLARDALTLIRAGIPTSIDIIDELETVPEIVGSKGQIYQTLLNLATNAAQAIGNRAGRIVIGSDNNGELEGVGRGVRLYIADDGSGMDEETRAHIFEPFFSTKEPRSGTGLGLSIVHGIVKSHGGSIRVESAPGKGTRFELLFPASDSKAAA